MTHVHTKDFIPNVGSFIEQGLVELDCDKEYLDRLARVIHREEYLPAQREPHCDKGPEDVDWSQIVERIKWSEPPEDFWAAKPAKTPLYKLTMRGEFSLIAHVMSLNGFRTKVLYRKKNVNPNRAYQSISTLYRKWNESFAFFFCYECNRLVAGRNIFGVNVPLYRWIDDELCEDGHSRIEIRTDCICQGESITQPYRTEYMDRVGHLSDGSFIVEKADSGFNLYVKQLSWAGPHCPVMRNNYLEHFPATVKPWEIRERMKFHRNEIEFVRTCKYCDSTMDVGHFHDKETCHGCASRLYGIVY